MNSLKIFNLSDHFFLESQLGRTPLESFPRVGRAPIKGGFKMPGFWVWGGAPWKEPNGRIHLYASRWPKLDLPFSWPYTTTSEIVHATADNINAPFQFESVALPARGEQYWDGRMTHNPTLQCFGGKYYLYYIGSTYSGPTPDEKALVETHIRSEVYARIQIGVAVAEHPAGPWKRFDAPLLSARPGAWDEKLVTNPSVVEGFDGQYYLFYRSNTPAGLRLGLAVSVRPEGPFVRVQDEPVNLQVLGCSVEDPYVWRGKHHYHMIVKDMTGEITGERHSGAHLISHDLLTWVSGPSPKAYSKTVVWESGVSQNMGSLERPQLLLENGQPYRLFAAIANGPGGFDEARSTWNINLPLYL